MGQLLCLMEWQRERRAHPHVGGTYRHWSATSPLSDPLLLIACSSWKAQCQKIPQEGGRKHHQNSPPDGPPLPCQQTSGLHNWARVTGAGSFHRATECFSHHKWCFLLLLFLGVSFPGFCHEETENQEETLNREIWKKVSIFLSWLFALVSALYCHPVRKVSLPYAQDTVIGTSTL